MYKSVVDKAKERGQRNRCPLFKKVVSNISEPLQRDLKCADH